MAANDPLDLSLRLASLQIERGDVIVALSALPEDRLLVRSADLAMFKWFAPGLSERWRGPSASQIVDPESRTNIKITTYILGMQRAGRSRQGGEAGYVFSLERVVSRAIGEPPHIDTLSDIVSRSLLWSNGFTTAWRICLCDLSQGYDERLEEQDQHYGIGQLYKTHDYAIRIHKLLFGLLYGIRSDFSSITLSKLAKCVVEIVAYAEYYTMLSAIAPTVTKKLLQHPGLWGDVALEPLYWLCLATKLRSPEIFEESIRHLAGSHRLCYRSLEDSKIGDMLDTREVALLVYRKRVGSSSTNNEIRSGLACLSQTLHTEHRTWGRRPHFYRGLFLQTLMLKRKTRMWRAQFLATAIFNQWLTKMLHGLKAEVPPSEIHWWETERAIHRCHSEVQQYHSLARTITAIKAAHMAQSTTVFGLPSESEGSVA